MQTLVPRDGGSAGGGGGVFPAPRRRQVPHTEIVEPEILAAVLCIGFDPAVGTVSKAKVWSPGRAGRVPTVPHSPAPGGRASLAARGRGRARPGQGQTDEDKDECKLESKAMTTI